MSVVEEAIRFWEGYRAGTIQELEGIAEDQWDFRPGEGARSVREMGRHIAEASVAFTEQLTSEEPNFGRLFDKEVRAQLFATLPTGTSRSEVIDLLRTTGSQNAQKLRSAGDEVLTRTMRLFGVEQSRVTGLWFAAAHEMYHRGQLATYARAIGQVPVMTQQMLKKGRSV